MHTSVPERDTKGVGESSSDAAQASLGEALTADGVPSQPRPSRSWIDWILLVGAVVVAAVGFWRLQMVVRWNLASPYDLVFESPNLASINGLRNGLKIYDPAV